MAKSRKSLPLQIAGGEVYISIEPTPQCRMLVSEMRFRTPRLSTKQVVEKGLKQVGLKIVSATLAATTLNDTPLWIYQVQ